MRSCAETGLPLLDDPRRGVRIPSRLAFAVLCAVVALIVGTLLEPVMLRPFFFPAAVAFIGSAVATGAAYGVLTSAIFATGHALVHLPPRGSFALQDHREVVAIAGFFLAGSIVSLLGGALRTAYDRLRDQNRLLRTLQAQREDLLSALTHDIRSPLGVVTGNAALLALHAGEEDAASVRRRALLIKTSAMTIASMLGDLTDAATLENGHVKLERAPIDLGTFVAHLKERLEATLAMDRVKVEVPSGLPPVDVDPQRFERILVNVLTNALKYSPPTSSVALRAKRRDDTLIVSVADEGHGIDAEDLPHIFDKYYRSRDAHSQAGVGLGLFIARLLVEAHGGTIWAESTVGAGTTFHMALPAALSSPPVH